VRSWPFEEYIEWLAYLEKRPIGWREDFRTYNIMRSFSELKSKPEDVFPSLGPIFGSKRDEAAGKKLLGSAFHTFMLKAKGGAVIEGL